MNLDPNYLKARAASGGVGSPFPAQVRFTKLHDFAPLEEAKFCHLVHYNDGTNVFRHRIGKREVASLLQILAKPDEAAPAGALPYETNGYRRDKPLSAAFEEKRRMTYGAAGGGGGGA